MEVGRVDALIEGLQASDPKARREAVKGLGRLGPKAADAVPALIVALEDQDRGVRIEAAVTLGHIGPRARAAIPALARHLRDPEEFKTVRDWAGSALGRIGSDSLQVLVDCLQEDVDRHAYLSAIQLLEKFGPAAAAAIPRLVIALQRDDDEIRFATDRTLVAIGPAAAEAIIPLLDAEDPTTRLRAGRYLLQFDPRHERSIVILIESLSHEDFRVRREAAWASEFADPLASPTLVMTLVQALHDKEREVREPVAATLSGYGPHARAGIGALIEALRDPEMWVRLHTLDALGKIGPNAIAAEPKLIELLNKDRFHEVRIAAAQALGNISPPTSLALPALREVLGGSDLDEDLRDAIETAILKIEK